MNTFTTCAAVCCVLAARSICQSDVVGTVLFLGMAFVLIWKNSKEETHENQL